MAFTDNHRTAFNPTFIAPRNNRELEMASTSRRGLNRAIVRGAELGTPWG